MIEPKPDAFVNGSTPKQADKAPQIPRKSDAGNPQKPAQTVSKAKVEHPLSMLVSLLESQIQRVNDGDLNNMVLEVLGSDGRIASVAQVSISPQDNLLIEVTRGVDIVIDLTSPEWKPLELVGWQKPNAKFPLPHRFFNRKIDPTTVALHLANALRQALEVASDRFYRFS
jgi:hypothetical protein